MFSENYFSILYNIFICIGDNSEVDTPVLIPNTEVKRFSGENSESEDSTLPMFFFML